MVIRNKTKALISLLDDPEPAVFREIERELVKKNARIIPALEEKWENSPDEICQERIENLIRHLHMKEIKRELRSWAREEDPSLLEGWRILDKATIPGSSFHKIERQIENLRKEVWLEMNPSLTSLEKITVLNHVLFTVHGYSLSPRKNQSPRDNSLSSVLEAKTGNRCSLAMLYAIVARKLNFPLAFIDFPHNPLLAWSDPLLAREAHGETMNTDILFYINPAGKGSVTGIKELEFSLKKMKVTPESRYFRKGDNRIFLRRLAEKLEKAYTQIQEFQKAETIRQLKNALTSTP
jgi:regulator of sirC expression with transglutaminase-like and TPR domain